MQFKVVEPTIRDLAYEGKGSFHIEVFGLESWRDVAKITVNVKRKNLVEGGHSWAYDIDTPSYSVEAKSADAWSNFGLALQEAGRKIEQYVGLEDKMEMIFQEGEAYRKAEADRIAKEKKAAYDADPEVGKKLANRVINEMRRIAKQDLGRWGEAEIKCFSRGEHKEQVIKVTHSYRGLTLFSLRYNRISRKTAVDIVADSNLDMLEVSGINMPDPKVVNFLLAKSKK